MNGLLKIFRRRVSSNLNDCKIKTDKREDKGLDDDLLLRYLLTTSFFGGMIECLRFLHRMDNPRRYYSHKQVDNRRDHMLLYTTAYTARGVVFGSVLVPAYCTIGLIYLVTQD